MTTTRRTAVTVLLGLILAAAAPAAAQEGKLEIRDGESIKLFLERHVGQRLSLIVREGPELTGTLVKVGDHVVHLGALQGRDFYDAVIRLDRIDGVVVRARGR